jgi:hypothetical protein
MNASEHLREALLATRQARYEDALRGHVWFHENALRENRSLRAVRLSYGIGGWADLGRVFPKAMDALEAARDAAAATLLRGEGGTDAFHDVLAIDEELCTPEKTRDLYAALTASQPDLADECASMALPVLVALRDFALARQAAPDPEQEIEYRAELLAWECGRIKRTPLSKFFLREESVRRYAAHVKLHKAVMAGNGLRKEAARLARLAVRLLADPSLRRAVQAELDKSGHGPRWQRPR